MSIWGQAIDKIKRKENNSLVTAVLINAIILGGLLLFFSPANRIDDYGMECTLYGRYTGQSVPYLQFSNSILAYALCALLKVFPMIPWYAMLQFFFIFISFVSITWVIFQRKSIKLNIFWVFFLVFFEAWDFYIYYTFTKTSGILIIAGMFLLFYAIDCRCKNVNVYIIGILLVLLGNLYRTTVFYSVCLVFFGAFLYWIFKEKKERDDKAFFKTILFVLLIVVLFLGYQIEFSVSKHLKSQSGAWAEYHEVQSVWSGLYDFAWPDYDEYIKVYDELGISRNDYYMLRDYGNRTDNSWLTWDNLQAMRTKFDQAVKNDNASIADTIVYSIRNVLRYWTSDPTFYFWLCCIICFLLGTGANALWVFVCNIGVIVGYLYLSYCGRVMIHTDAILFLAAGVINLYFVKGECLSTKKAKQILYLTTLIFSIYNMRFYDLLANGPYSYANRNDANEYNRQLNILSQDSDHLYIFGGKNLNAQFYQGLTGFARPDAGYLHNIYGLSESAIPRENCALANYGVDNPLEEMIDNPSIYFVCTDEYLTQMPCVLEYMREHFDANTEMYKVKDVDIFNVYVFYTEDIDLDAKPEIGEEQWDIQYSLHEDKNGVRIEGSAFKNGTDSFIQQVYIKTRNKDTQEESIHYTTQKNSTNKERTSSLNGKYSDFAGKISGKSEEIIELIIYDGQDYYSYEAN